MFNFFGRMRKLRAELDLSRMESEQAQALITAQSARIRELTDTIHRLKNPPTIDIGLP